MIEIILYYINYLFLAMSATFEIFSTLLLIMISTFIKIFINIGLMIYWSSHFVFTSIYLLFEYIKQSLTFTFFKYQLHALYKMLNFIQYYAGLIVVPFSMVYFPLFLSFVTDPEDDNEIITFLKYSCLFIYAAAITTTIYINIYSFSLPTFIGAWSTTVMLIPALTFLLYLSVALILSANIFLYNNRLEGLFEYAAFLAGAILSVPILVYFTLASYSVIQVAHTMLLTYPAGPFAIFYNWATIFSVITSALAIHHTSKGHSSSLNILWGCVLSYGALYRVFPFFTYVPGMLITIASPPALLVYYIGFFIYKSWCDYLIYNSILTLAGCYLYINITNERVTSSVGNVLKTIAVAALSACISPIFIFVSSLGLSFLSYIYKSTWSLLPGKQYFSAIVNNFYTAPQWQFNYGFMLGGLSGLWYAYRVNNNIQNGSNLRFLSTNIPLIAKFCLAGSLVLPLSISLIPSFVFTYVSSNMFLTHVLVGTTSGFIVEAIKLVRQGNTDIVQSSLHIALSMAKGAIILPLIICFSPSFLIDFVVWNSQTWLLPILPTLLKCVGITCYVPIYFNGISKIYNFTEKYIKKDRSLVRSDKIGARLYTYTGALLAIACTVTICAWIGSYSWLLMSLALIGNTAVGLFLGYQVAKACRSLLNRTIIRDISLTKAYVFSVPVTMALLLPSLPAYTAYFMAFEKVSIKALWFIYTVLDIGLISGGFFIIADRFENFKNSINNTIRPHVVRGHQGSIGSSRLRGTAQALASSSSSSSSSRSLRSRSRTFSRFS